MDHTTDMELHGCRGTVEGFNETLSLGIAERGVLGATRGATLLH